VPHKSSDAVWKRFVTACDAFFDAKKAAQKQQKEERKAAYKEAKSTFSLQKEHDKLMRAYDKLSQEIATRENNISFLSKGGKNSNPLLEQMLQTIQKLKQDKQDLYQKIVELEKQFKNDAQKQ
jgi:seryl-tRNA synthetase